MPRSRSDDGSADNVSALQRGFAVLDCFAGSRASLANSDVSRLTGIPRPTVTRLIATLVALGHLRPAREADRFELAAGVVRLAEAFLGTLDVRGHARPHLVALAEATGASSYLGVRDGTDVLVIEGARARSAVAFLGADVGTRMALATSALGRAWLVGVDDTTRALVLKQLRGSVRKGAAGVPSDAWMAEARRAGYAVSLGEWHVDINAVGVPVRTPAGEVFTINCGSPSFVMPAERLRTVAIPATLAAAAAIARDIGGSAGPALTRAALPSLPAPATRRRPRPSPQVPHALQAP
jgi:DNA-binding IclR family transcriptional regulator